MHRPQTEVGGGEHADDAGRPERCAGVDADDACVCHLGPHEHHVYRIGAEVVGTKVIDVSGGAEEQFGIFRAKHACTEDRASHPRNLPPARSAGSDVLERLLEVGDEVAGRLDPHAEAHQRVGHLQR